MSVIDRTILYITFGLVIGHIIGELLVALLR